MVPRLTSAQRVALGRTVAALVLTISTAGVPRLAAAARQAPPDHTQFLLIVDESGSMGKAPPRTDRERLAILAARTFLDLLAPADRVAVAGMNELAGMSPESALTAFKPLTAERALAQARSRLDPDGAGLAAYRGRYTPCRDALERARGILTEWHGRDAGARQVLVFLTDGKCEGRGSQEPMAARAWLAGVAAHSLDPRLFRFYLLRFEGNQVSPGLTEYATVSGGRELLIPAGPARPRGLIKAFADVFAGAQGYATSLLTPGSGQRSFARAERVRILALRQAGDTAPLKITVTPAGGPPPQVTTGPVARFQRTVEPGLKAYEYRVATVVPNGTRFTVASTAADVVLIPDYRQLRAELSVLPQRCPEERGATLDHRRDTDVVAGGSTACVQVALVASRGPLAPADDLEFVGRFHRGPAGKGKFGAAESMVARADGFSANLPVATNAYLDLQGEATIAGMPLPLRSRPHPLRGQTVSWRISRVKQGKLFTSAHLGTIDAGDTTRFDVKLDGRFPAKTKIQLVPLQGLADHPCLAVGVAAQDGLSVQVSPGQTRTLVLASTRCRTGGQVTGSIRFVPPKDATLQAIDLPVVLTLVATSWWAYWGALVLRLLGLLFALLTLYCFINGWRKPARRLPAAKRRLAFYFSRDLTLLNKPRGDFRSPNAKRGAYELAPHLDGTGGWYRNAAIPLGSRGCKLPSPGTELALELQPNGSFRAVEVAPTLQLQRIDITRLSRPEKAFRPEELSATPRPTLRVGPLCRLYARLLGRLPKVRSLRLEPGVWYGVGDQKTSYFFKLDDSPF